ncbi:unnamed protein product [Sphagnum jensenii]|uniref:Uncharacterized protein n=1 Tax=Sphagnum jensenii TaxID=128206 RepID=A0ABP1A8U3_9BRYO
MVVGCCYHFIDLVRHQFMGVGSLVHILHSLRELLRLLLHVLHVFCMLCFCVCVCFYSGYVVSPSTELANFQSVLKYQHCILTTRKGLCSFAFVSIWHFFPPK